MKILKTTLFRFAASTTYVDLTYAKIVLVFYRKHVLKEHQFVVELSTYIETNLKCFLENRFILFC